MPVVHRKSSESLVLPHRVQTPSPGSPDGPRRSLRHSSPMRSLTVLSGGIGGARFLQGLLHAHRHRRPARCRARRGRHGRHQHRRRPVGARAQGLPRPRHGDVHPRRRHRPRARAGAGARRPGACARSWRPTASSRPGSASATATWPPTWCAPRCSRPATRSRRSPTALCRRWLEPVHGERVRLLPMTDDRVETHVAVADPDSPSGTPGRALPGVLDPDARRGPGRDGRRRRPRPSHPRPRCARGDHRRRPGAGAAVEPRRVGRHDPGRARGPRGPGRHRRAGGGPLPRRRGPARARHGPPAAERHRGRGQRGRRRAALRGPLARGRARRLAGRHRRRGRRRGPRGGRPAGRRRAADDDLDPTPPRRWWPPRSTSSSR